MVRQVDAAHLQVVGRLHLLVAVAPPLRERRGVLLGHAARRHLVVVLHGVVVHVVGHHLVGVHVGGVEAQLVAAREDEQRVQLQFTPAQVQRQRAGVDGHKRSHVDQGVGAFQRRGVGHLRGVAVGIELRHLVAVLVEYDGVAVHHAAQSVGPAGVVAGTLYAVVLGGGDEVRGYVGRVVLHAEHLVAVVGIVQRGRQSPVLLSDDVARQRQLDTPVAHLTIIYYARGGSQRRVHVLPHQQVVTYAVVELQRTAEQVVEQPEVHADVERRRLLPAQLRVGQVVVRIVQVLRVRRVLALRAVAGHEVGGRALVHVAVHAVGDAQLQEVEPRDVLHELFLRYVPAAADRPQRVVLVLGVESEEVGLVPSYAARQVIAVQVVVAHIGIERGVAVEYLALAGRQSAQALRAVVHQRLPALVVERLPVHADGGQRRVVVAVHQLLDEAG